MKVIAILENTITVGGGFNQGLNAILQMKKICERHFEFEVFTTNVENIKHLKKIGLNSVWVKFSLVDRLISLISLSPGWSFIQKYLRIIGPFEKSLTKHNVDLVYFLTQSSSPATLNRLNYITTAFDLSHRDTPEFPEVGHSREFHARERQFQTNRSRAVGGVTVSEQFSDSFSRRYGIDRNRLLSMPMGPSPFLSADISVDKSLVLKTYDLEEGYFFYPAQFWAHKNHIRILEALLLLREKGYEFKVVFAGGDKGNRTYVERFVTQHSLGGQVRFLGFVPSEHMRGLYEGCVAVTMPTYFGPTNLPPLEAWMIGKPLIYSSHLIDDVGEAAICVNPDDPGELAAAMNACDNSRIRTNLVKAGHLRLREIEQQRTESALKLRNVLLQFSARRRCWA